MKWRDRLHLNWCGFVFVVACCLSLVTSSVAGQVETIDGLRLVRLSGSPYELGRQHGELLRQEVRETVTHVLSYFESYLRIPWIRTWLVRSWLDFAWRQAKPFIPPDVSEELRGLSDGSGVPLRDLYRIHMVPDRTYACSSFAVWGRATVRGRLIHVRNLDWSMGAGIQEYPIVFIVRPTGKHAFVNIGWAGFIGALTGVNDAQLSVGQIGAKTRDATFAGEPMVFIMRRVLETSENLEQAAGLVQHAQRSVGINYVFADAKLPRGIVLETTRHHFRQFNADDPTEHRVAYARPFADAVLRADTAVDPVIRDLQLASQGNPARPGLEDPAGSAYDTRYLGQAAGISAHYGTLDAEAVRAIAQRVAPDSNVQSVVFAWPEVWVANAQGRVPAARTPYHHLNAAVLLEPRR